MELAEQRKREREAEAVQRREELNRAAREETTAWVEADVEASPTPQALNLAKKTPLPESAADADGSAVAAAERSRSRGESAEREAGGGTASAAAAATASTPTKEEAAAAKAAAADASYGVEGAGALMNFLGRLSPMGAPPVPKPTSEKKNGETKEGGSGAKKGLTYVWSVRGWGLRVGGGSGRRGSGGRVGETRGGIHGEGRLAGGGRREERSDGQRGRLGRDERTIHMTSLACTVSGVLGRAL
jgi:hypothetical protein